MAFDVTDPATLVLLVAPASTAGSRGEEHEREEDLQVTVDGRPVPVEALAGDHGSVAHIVRSPVGSMQISFTAVAAGPGPVQASTSAALDQEQLTYLRPSRYCPSDLLSGIAAYELGHVPVGPALLEAVGDWVASRLTYQVGSSGPLDTALDSLLAGRGVCRDFSHLAITMLRALEVPARLVSVYAPGLSPMDFHAVVEAHVDGAWRLLDAARMAPRQSLVRVATGRDAADTAFVTVLGGDAQLLQTEVTAVVDGDLPFDDHLELFTLA
ncbi:MAG TPA: transglutaminase family protein [Microthrixaceae bacterium]|nr:transglutaminase family protein [Microthrixaceae bacterium]